MRIGRHLAPVPDDETRTPHHELGASRLLIGSDDHHRWLDAFDRLGQIGRGGAGRQQGSAQQDGQQESAGGHQSRHRYEPLVRRIRGSSGEGVVTLAS
jgi:hypothetical protein